MVWLHFSPQAGHEQAGTLASATAWVSGRRGFHETGRTAVGPDGRFRIEGLAPGPSKLKLITPFGDHFHEFELEGNLDLAFDLATGWITGRVVWAAGGPVGGSRITLTDRELIEKEGVVADEQGAFSIPRALPGSPVLSVLVDGRLRLRSRVEVHPGTETVVELRLPGLH